jgi:hypothetical protein
VRIDVTPRGWIVAALLSAGACGSQPARNEQAAKQVEQGAQQVQRGAGAVAEGAKRGAAEMAQGVQQMARGLQQMAQGSATAVPFEALVALLPEIPGWTRSEPRGENVSRPIASSHAEARYSLGESRLRLEITDTALSEMLIAPVAMFMAPGYAERSPDGDTRATTVGGYPAAEGWNRRSRRGEVTVLVAKRFLVKGSGDDVPDVKVVQQAVEMVDFGKLAALK